METAQIWELTMPKLTLEDIYQAEGADYSKRPPAPTMVKLRQKLLEEASKIIRPIMITREVEIIGKDEQKLYLKNGYSLTSKLLVKNAGKAEKLLLFAYTLGEIFETRISKFTKKGKTLEAFIFNAIGTACVTKGVKLGLNKLQKYYKQKGMKTTFAMGPGHSYWTKLEDMKVILQLLESGRIGLTLSETNLILPSKSLAFVMGVGSKLTDYHDNTNCDFCSIKFSCRLNKCC